VRQPRVRLRGQQGAVTAAPGGEVVGFLLDQVGRLRLQADHQQALDWFTMERVVLLAAVDHAAATGFDTHTWQLTWTLESFLDWQGHWHDWAATGRAAVLAAHRLADPTAQAHAHHTLANAYTQLGRFDDAHTPLRHTLDLAVQTGDQSAQSRAHHDLSYLWERRGNYPQALDHALEALTLCQATGPQNRRAEALSVVGWCHARVGDYQQALTACQQALTLLQELGDRVGQATRGTAWATHTTTSATTPKPSLVTTGRSPCSAASATATTRPPP
jgi:tetratricopeptide (TPR) repeat protein